ncbi:MAG: PorT family protein [Muribaculaceae bacterium]|nr:PorT family protein [Muribaculaceae bacterium]
MKRKFILSILVLLFFTVSGYAQDDKVIWGLKASLDAELPSKWHGDGGGVTMFRPGYGFTIGGVSNIYLGKNFYFEPGLSLAYSQYKYKNLLFPDSDGTILETDPKIYKWCFQIPLVFGYTIDIPDRYAFNVFTGPQVRYAFAGKTALKNNQLEEDTAEYVNLWDMQRRFDLSWKVGVGIPVNNFQISLEADFGITDLLKGELSFRENRVGVGVTYYF